MNREGRGREQRRKGLSCSKDQMNIVELKTGLNFKGMSVSHSSEVRYV